MMQSQKGPIKPATGITGNQIKPQNKESEMILMQKGPSKPTTDITGSQVIAQNKESEEQITPLQIEALTELEKESVNKYNNAIWAARNLDSIRKTGRFTELGIEKSRIKQFFESGWAERKSLETAISKTRINLYKMPWKFKHDFVTKTNDRLQNLGEYISAKRQVENIRNLPLYLREVNTEMDGNQASKQLGEEKFLNINDNPLEVVDKLESLKDLKEAAMKLPAEEILVTYYVVEDGVQDYNNMEKRIRQKRAAKKNNK
ncbi:MULTISPECIES: hypothetical protein [Pseudoalteromonas]|uniref:Uncharacterized protein n=1 Tax=Pseudoalteromonas obscura TaxID=3048491 RepID=A0ABT7EKT3_9GAMM|nr:MULTISPECIES: hypothetical protein [Pseudoalteromonas]MBQ4837140.1 hypothetical protein [Pseudoalteromonas luteoviolacea]MDK2595634.1 hypothetical protein [Pseudoalteromonas sp. P94(2023)]